MNNIKNYDLSLEKYFDRLADNNPYLILSQSELVRTLFNLHFIISGLKKNKPCLYVCDHNLHTVLYRAKNIGFNLTPYLNKNQLILLQSPRELSSLMMDLHNITLILNDLKVYIDSLKPERIVFDKIDTMIPMTDLQKSEVVYNRLAFFIRNLHSTVFLNIQTGENSFIREKLSKLTAGKYILESDPYDFISGKKNKIVYNSILKGNTHFEFNYKIQYNRGIETLDSEQKEENLNVESLHKVIYPHQLSQIGDILEKEIPNIVKIEKYETEAEIEELTENSPTEIIFIPDFLNNYKSLKLVSKLKKQFPAVKFVFLTSKFIAEDQRIRAQKRGINGFCYYPIKKENLISSLKQIYNKPRDIDKRVNFSHTDIQIHRNRFESKKYEVGNHVSKALFKQYLDEYSFYLIDKDRAATFIKIEVDNLYFLSIKKSLNKFEEFKAIFSYKKENLSIFLAIVENVPQKEIDSLLNYLNIVISASLGHGKAPVSQHEKINTQSVEEMPGTKTNTNNDISEQELNLEDLSIESYSYPWDYTEIKEIINKVVYG